MTPKHKAILAQLPVGARKDAEAYYEVLAVYEAEYSELRRAQLKVRNTLSELRKRQRVVDNSLVPAVVGQAATIRPRGKLYIDLDTGFYYEGVDAMYACQRLTVDGYNGKNKHAWPRGPLVELPEDHPFRDKRRVALLCNKLEGKP